MAQPNVRSQASDGSLSLRPATLQDAALLLQWRNDPETRAASHTTDEISPDTHLAWLAKSLSDPTRHLFIAEENGVPVGTLRTDESDGVLELSWTVAANGRGRGIGKRMVALLASQIPGPIRAEVKIGNEASRRIAEHAGLRFERECHGVLHFVRGPLRANQR